MIPAIVPEDTESAAERMLHPLLRDGLDERYTVFHSFRTITPNRDGLLLDGEIDFLIFSPAEGFLVLEAKSGAVVYDGPTRRWFLNGMHIHDPVQQARGGKYKLRDFLLRRLGKSLPCTFAHAVCFPHTYAEPSVLPPDVDRSILFTATDLEHLSTRVHQVFASAGPPHRPLGEKEVEQLRDAVILLDVDPGDGPLVEPGRIHHRESGKAPAVRGTSRLAHAAPEAPAKRQLFCPRGDLAVQACIAKAR